MKKYSLLIILLLCFYIAFSGEEYIKNPYSSYFKQSYLQNPDIPKGILEAVAFTNTRFQHLIQSEANESCIGLPKAYGVMGLTLNGKSYFRNNLIKVSELSGYSVDEIINNPEKHIMAYAAAYQYLLEKAGFDISKIENHISILNALSELPGNTPGQSFALSSQLYSIFSFLNNESFQKEYRFSDHHIDMKIVFGKENLKVLSSKKVIVRKNYITGDHDSQYSAGLSPPCLDYPLAVWNPADLSNYSSRNGTPITAVTIHDVEGTYAGCISWFQNPSANVSAHYVLRSSDGQITQMVCEIDKGWHVGSENAYTIGFEHEGYAAQPGWFTPAMMQSSADLVKDICNDYGISPLRTFDGPATVGQNILGGCIKIKGHQHYPNQTHVDPGVYWDWEYYYQLINDNPPITNYTDATGQFFDTGGPAGAYNNDERYLVSIEPPGADTLALVVNEFDLEVDWDYLYLYDNSQPLSPLIGVYTGTSIPDTFITGGSILLEFRSDCATTNPGWDMSWTSSPVLDTTTAMADVLPNLQLSIFPNPTSGVARITNTEFTITNVEVLDLFSRPVAFTFDIQHSILDIQHSPPGFYFVTFALQGKKKVLKLIKE